MPENSGSFLTHLYCTVDVNNNMTTSGLYPVLMEGIMSSNRKGDRFIFREKQTSRRETLKQLKICEILSHGVRYGNYAHQESVCEVS